MNLAWLQKDRAFGQRLLDGWQAATGYQAPRAGLVFVEPAKSETGPGQIWIAGGLAVEPIERRYAGGDPGRSVTFDALVYCQLGDVHPADWMDDFGDVADAVLATLEDEGDWPQYVHVDTAARFAQKAELKTGIWVYEALQLRFKVG